MNFTGFKPVTATRRILQTVVLVTLYDPQSSDDFLLMGSAFQDRPELRIDMNRLIRPR
jgi:hypothetical protein